jgi:MFS superfamily sulfate permease-like transporter
MEAITSQILFFAAVGNFNETFTNLGDTHALILSMRGVPRIDTSGLQAMGRLLERLKAQGSLLMLAGTHPDVLRTLEQGGLLEVIGEHNIFWSVDQAIVTAEERGAARIAKRRNFLFLPYMYRHGAHHQPLVFHVAQTRTFHDDL